MSNISWVFDGMGTSIIMFFLGLIFGGTAGYKIAMSKKTIIRQKQVTGDNSNQSQIGVIKNGR